MSPENVHDNSQNDIEAIMIVVMMMMMVKKKVKEREKVSSTVDHMQIIPRNQ